MGGLSARRSYTVSNRRIILIFLLYWVTMTFIFAHKVSTEGVRLGMSFRMVLFYVFIGSLIMALASVFAVYKLWRR